MMAFNSDTLRQRADQIRTTTRQLSDPAVIVKLTEIATHFDRLAAYIDRATDGVIVGTQVGLPHTTLRRR
jgi:hypothetical protein